MDLCLSLDFIFDNETKIRSLLALSSRLDMTIYNNTYISSWFFTLNSSKINHFRKNCSEVRESGIGKERDHKIVSLCSNVNFISLILVFIASEEDSNSLGHSRRD